MESGLIVVISGPSGVGKGTLCHKISEHLPELEVSISATTRAPRRGEEEGKSYFFLTEREFKQKINEDFFLEWARLYDDYYGTPAAPVKDIVDQGKDILLELDVQGAMQVKKNIPGAVFIFIAPPSMKELQRRITGRGTEKPEHIRKRMEIALKELKMYRDYDYLVINNNLEEAVLNIKAVIMAEKCKVGRHAGIWLKQEE
ncbi:MAG: guanylate kinase [Firmicutes bacterium]|jgi:guanylate kinase|nr:guanylate kinase [Bacillota bacterium]